LTGGNEQYGRASRLTKAVEFRRVFSRSKVSQDRHFRVLYRPNDLDRSRLGLAVSKKVCPRATGRNRLKRLIRESFRRHQELLAAQGGVDIVVLPKRGAASMCNTTLRNALEQHWARCATFAAATVGESSEGKD
jgi:ribonuclease P protein component